MGAIVPDPVEDYAVVHTTSLPPLIQELVATTQERMGARAGIMSGHVQGTLLQMLVASLAARRVLEVGTFTGFSALMMAAALPDDGRLITCDQDPVALAIARGFFARSEHGHKIEVREGPAAETLATLDAPFDVVYLDGDHWSYTRHYETVLPLLAPRGLIVVDNVLRRGDVLTRKDEDARLVADFADHVQHDPRVINTMLTVRDGLMLIRRRDAEGPGA